MRVGFIADVHLGNFKKLGGASSRSLNLRCRQAIAVFHEAVGLAKANCCSALVVLGDLFDYARPEPQLIGEVLEIIRAWNTPMIFLAGNHDMCSDEKGDNALAPFAPLTSDATVFDTPGSVTLRDDGQVELLFLPHSAGADVAVRLSKFLRGRPQLPSSARRVLCLHAGISDESTPAFLRGTKGSIDSGKLLELMREHNISNAFAGDWHNHQTWYGPRETIVQLGALVPTGWDNPGLEGYGMLAILNTEDGDIFEQEIGGPRFVAVRGREALNRALSAPPADSDVKLYLRATVSRADLAEVTVGCAEHLDTGHLAGFEVLIDGEEAAKEARTAAVSARAADTMAESLSAFVEKMPLDEGVSRETVLDRSSTYLAKGGG